MFENLSQRLQSTVKRLRGEGRMTEDNIRETLREVRVALLEADVALPVVKAFIEDVRARAVGKEVLASLTPGQAVIKLVHDALVQVMEGAPETANQAPLATAPDRLNLAARPPAVILIAGLQGAGKTTTVGKLAHYLQERRKKNVLVVSTDIYRPAAIEQLRKLAEQVGATFSPSSPQESPVDIARRALAQASKSAAEVVIIDTAGRLHVDAAMMEEITAIHQAVQPVETLFVVDSMTGQDAVNTAKAFNEALALTGVILTKVDGDARGGAALSVRYVTGKPIKFLGLGEKLEALEPFHPTRLASRILGMGDVLGLVEQAQRSLDQEQAKKLAQKVTQGKGFDLGDFREQLLQMQSMGGLSSLMDKLPGMGAMANPAQMAFGDQQSRRLVAIINAMTPHERHEPDIIRGSRKRRIANGSGTQVQDVNRLLKQFGEMQKMMKRMGKGGIHNMLRGMKGKFPGMPF